MNKHVGKEIHTINGGQFHIEAVEFVGMKSGRNTAGERTVTKMVDVTFGGGKYRMSEAELIEATTPR